MDRWMVRAMIALVGAGMLFVAGCDDGTCSSGNCACEDGEDCNFECADGGCSQSCSSGSVCEASCAGGGCSQSCSSGAECNFSCAGGDCTQSCLASGTCKASCTGNGCTSDVGAGNLPF
jgi:hypothetical protein